MGFTPPPSNDFFLPVTILKTCPGNINTGCLCPSTRMLVIATINSTDLKKQKEKIIERFKQKGKELPLNLNTDYETDFEE